jgi:alpha-tubulin suppressor-like RCC1 family protein
MKKVALLSSFVVTALLAGCGGGGGGGSSPTAQGSAPSNPTPTTPQATAAVQTPNNLAWNIAAPLTVVLKDPSGNVIPAAQVTCAANNATNLTVAANCSSVTGTRIGSHSIVVSGGGVTADAAITVVPQQQALGMHASTDNTGYSLIVTPNQQVLGWGANNGGVLGQNNDQTTLQGVTLPVTVLNSAGSAPLTSIAQVSSGDQAALALTTSGQVYEWGSDSPIAGAREDGAANNATYLPGLISNAANNGPLSHIVQVSVGGNNAAALADDGTVYTWGDFTGQNNPQGGGTYAQYPGQVKTSSGVLTNVVRISAGTGFTLALTSEGQVYAWGYNGNAGSNVGGPIPTSSNANGETYAATPITRADNGQPLTNIVAISAGYFVSLALDSSGHVWAWGDNTNGELGQGNNNAVTGAVEVQGPLGTSGPLSKITMVAAGEAHGLAMDASGNLWSWGYSQDGQLGDGPNHPRVNSSSLPAAVVSTTGNGQLTGATAIAAGYANSFALMPDGSILAWGITIDGTTGQGGTLGSGGQVPGQALYLYVPTPVMNQAGTGNLSIAPLAAYQNLTKLGIFSVVPG